MNGDKYRCGHCGFVGYCYGTPIIGGSTGGFVTPPWCSKCGMNDMLTPIPQSDATEAA